MKNRFETFLKAVLIANVLIFTLLQLNVHAAQVNLNWDQSDPAPEGYRIFKRLSNQDYDYMAPAWQGTGTTATITSLEDNTTYFFVIRTYNSYGNESSDSAEISLSVVVASNSAPVLDSIGPKTVNENETIAFTLAATDPDEDTVTYAVSNLPAGAIFNTSNGSFTWTPEYQQTGNYFVIFTANDTGSPVLSDSETVTITVGDVNRPPVLSAIGSKTIDENLQLAFSITSTDPDGDSISYSAGPLPAGAQFDEVNGVFEWTPEYQQTGNYQVVFTVSDNGSPVLTDSETVTITVGDVNRPPVLSTIGSISGTENETLEFTISAYDPDGNLLTYSASDMPDGASIDQNTGLYSWTPDYTGIGTYNIIFTVTDNGSPAQSDSVEITIIIDAANSQNPDSDRDGDHVTDSNDAFPDNPDEWEDTDNDGLGNMEDSDDDNDGMSDEWELQNGLDPLYNDADDDPDQDGKTNGEEYEEDSDPAENTKSSHFMIKNLIKNSTENGGTAKYSIRLLKKPDANVTATLQSMDITEGTVHPDTLLFTPDNWNSASHIITVTGVDDHEADGSQSYKIKLIKNGSSGFQAVASDFEEITVINVDNDSPGITVSELSGQLSESGSTAIFDVHLNFRPDSNVTLQVETDSSEASLSPATLTFTPDNWNTVQSVTVTGVDDSLEDGNRQFDIIITAESGDTGYHSINIDKIKALNIDNDTPGITVSNPEWNTREDSDNTTFSVKLNKEPYGDVIINISCSNEQEGYVTVSSLSFTTEDWNHEKTVTVIGVDDQILDGDQEFTVTLSVDMDTTVDTSGYTLLTPAYITLTNEDNEEDVGTPTKENGLPINDAGLSSAAGGGGCFIGSLLMF